MGARAGSGGDADDVPHLSLGLLWLMDASLQDSESGGLPFPSPSRLTRPWVLQYHPHVFRRLTQVSDAHCISAGTKPSLHLPPPTIYAATWHFARPTRQRVTVMCIDRLGTKPRARPRPLVRTQDQIMTPTQSRPASYASTDCTPESPDGQWRKYFYQCCDALSTASLYWRHSPA